MNSRKDLPYKYFASKYNCLLQKWDAPNRVTEFLSALEKGVFIAEHLLSEDYQKIKQLNQIYQDLPADFTDLSLIAISERLNIPAIATLDKDFDIYRRYRNQFFIRVFYPQ